MYCCLSANDICGSSRHGGTNYGSDWQKEYINQCLDFVLIHDNDVLDLFARGSLFRTKCDITDYHGTSPTKIEQKCGLSVLKRPCISCNLVSSGLRFVLCVQTVAFMCVFAPFVSPGISNPSWKLSHQMVLQNGCPRVKPKNLMKLSVGKLNRFARLQFVMGGGGGGAVGFFSQLLS